MKERAARSHAVRIIRAEGDGPWICSMCDKPIQKLGRRRDEGMVHHKDENPFNNERSNLEVLHSACHHRHHHAGKPKPPSVGAAVSVRWTGVPKTEAHRAKLSTSVKAAWERGDYAGRR